MTSEQLQAALDHLLNVQFEEKQAAFRHLEEVGRLEVQIVQLKSRLGISIEQACFNVPITLEEKQHATSN